MSTRRVVDSLRRGVAGGGHLPLNPLYILNATDRPVSRLGGAFLLPPPGSPFLPLSLRIENTSFR